MIPIKESCKQSPFTIWLIKRKRVLITVKRNAWIPQPLLLIPEYSGINKGQRVPDRSKTARRNPLVKYFLTVKQLEKEGEKTPK